MCGIHSVRAAISPAGESLSIGNIYRFSSLLDEEQGVLLCLPFILFLPLWWWIIQKSKSLSLQGIRTHSYVLQSLLLRSMFISLSGLILMVTVLFPLLALFAHARYGLFFTELIQRQGERTLHSIIYAFGGASLIVILALLYSADFQQRKWAVPVLFFLFCLPGILIASAWLQFRSHWIGRIPPFIQIITILLAYSLKYFVFGYIASLFLWQQYGFRTREVDTLLALGLWQKIRFIYLPSFWRPGVLAICLVSVFLWQDVGITILLHPPGWDTLSINYFNLLHYGSEPRTATAGLLMMLIPAVVVSIAFLFQKKMLVKS